MITRLPCAACVALALAAPCAATPASAAQTTAAARLDDLVERYFETQLELNPVAATFIGDHRYDDRLQRPDHREASRAVERRYLDELATIDRAGLAPGDALNHEVFGYGRRIALENFDYPGHLLPMDQFNNPAAFFAQLGSGRTVQPFATVKDYENFLARLRAFPAWVDGAIAAMRAGVERGVVLPRVLVERMVPQFAELAVTKAEQSVFWEPVRNMPPGIPAAERERLARLYREALQEHVLPAYRRLQGFCSDQYLPAARASVGLSALPGGGAWYAYLARAFTTTDTPVAQIHEAGLSEVARIDAEISRIAGRIGFRGDVQALAESLRQDARFHFATPGELLGAYRAQLDRATAAAPRLFSLMPKAALDIRPTEPFREQSSAGAEYYAPAADGSRPGIFYVNTWDLPARPAYSIETIFLHEAIPGHHFQIALVIENPRLPRYRRFASDDPFSREPDMSTAYVEGWGLYAESLGEELGFFADPYQKLGNLFAESWRAARLVVDTGLHARGWTREQAVEYLLAHSALSRTEATAEVERYIAWPGQALAYKTGQMKIRDLRRRAEQALGARFDVRAFHARVLEDGALPLAVLEAKIDRWLRAQAGAAP